MPPGRSPEELLADPKSNIEFRLPNPKKRDSKSFERYEAYKRAKTIGEALQLGSTKADLKCDHKRGFLKLLDGPASAARGASLAEALQRRAPAGVVADAAEDTAQLVAPGAAVASSSSSSSAATASELSSGGGSAGTLIKRMRSRGIDFGAAIEAPLPPPEPSQASAAAPPGPEASRPAASPQRQAVTTAHDAAVCSSNGVEPVEEYTPTVPDDDCLEDVAQPCPDEQPPCAAAFFAEVPEPQEALLSHGSDVPCGEVGPLSSSDIAMAERGDCDQSEEEIRLIFRLGMVQVKTEPVDDRPPATTEVMQQATDASLGSEAGARTAEVNGTEQGEAPDASAGSLPHLFRKQCSSQAPPSANMEGGQDGEGAAGDQEEEDAAAKAEREEKEAKEQFEAAQIASYESNVSEKQLREAREKELLQQGSMEPLEQLDEELMLALYCGEGIMLWLESMENRGLLFRYLKLRAKATNWYSEPAKAFFDSQRQLLQELLEQPDAAHAVSAFLQETTARVEEEMFAMPEKGRFIPKIFAQGPSSCEAEAEGLVEVD